jgi:hypothetical protein
MKRVNMNVIYCVLIIIIMILVIKYFISNKTKEGFFSDSVTTDYSCERGAGVKPTPEDTVDWHTHDNFTKIQCSEQCEAWSPCKGFDFNSDADYPFTCRLYGEGEPRLSSKGANIRSTFEYCTKKTQSAEAEKANSTIMVGCNSTSKPEGWGELGYDQDSHLHTDKYKWETKTIHKDAREKACQDQLAKEAREFSEIKQGCDAARYDDGKHSWSYCEGKHNDPIKEGKLTWWKDCCEMDAAKKCVRNSSPETKCKQRRGWPFNPSAGTSAGTISGGTSSSAGTSAGTSSDGVGTVDTHLQNGHISLSTQQKNELEGIHQGFSHTVSKNQIKYISSKMMPHIQDLINSTIQNMVKKNADNYLSISLDGPDKGTISCLDGDYNPTPCPPYLA